MKAGLSINKEKTKVSVSSKDKRDHMDHNNCRLSTIATGSIVLHLKSSFHDTGELEMDIRKKLAVVRSAVQSLSNIWKSPDITNTSKFRLMKSLVWPIAKYECEGWTLKKADHRHIKAFETWCFRRILRVSSTQRKTNEWILQTIRKYCTV